MSNLLWLPGHELILDDIVRADNCRLYDSKGKSYVDLEAGVWCTCIGQGNGSVRKALADQFALIGHTGFNYTSGIVGEVADEVLTLLDLDGGKCVFLCSGSEAVEYGVRVVQSISDRPLLMTMADSYCGAYGSANLKTPDEWFTFDWTPCATCSQEGECDRRCEHWSTIPETLIGGFLLEPGSSSGLVRFPPRKLIRSIAALVKRNDGFTLINEVTTGVGQTGSWFGFQHYDLKPDVVALGKGIGNGYPVSVTGLSARVIERLGDRPVKYAQSHQNDPLGAVVVRAVIRFIEENDLIARSRELSKILLTGLAQIASRHPRIGEIRARGLMVGIELVDNPDNAFTIKIHRDLIEQGYIVGRRPDRFLLRLDPALTIDQRDIEDFLVTFERVLAES